MDSTTVQFEIELPIRVYDALIDYAGKTITDVKEVAARSIARSVRRDQPFEISHENKLVLEKAIGRNLTSDHELVEVVKRLAEIRVGEIDVPLTPMLWERLRSRCIGPNFNAYVVSNVTAIIKRFVGV